MIVEQRLYTFHPGNLDAFLALYQQKGMAVQLRHLPALLGYYVGEIGALNQTVTLWGYHSLQQRMDCREALFADEEWTAFLTQARPLMQAQECRILKPAPFFRSRLAYLVEDAHSLPHPAA
ncbi:MAG: NIPSNAP family protein [Pigmentiphaga sp.]|uniref:NIPSNAP family protein n=1 Tax=Pigmentiphaga sp. TaxID=1977564 RepID=UPI0029B34085|nr:NIPSNAP family protein [Pigmentiphaga sp.]MDX3906139.1 NIPSNAP family protein [Pigmentiphaga sp.]